ncbi:TPA: lipopolysaccharide biosynthesis protein [Serratia marcescens]|uniref:Flippase n=2 Tax=Serratia TaxID=613 RepID=A0AAP8PKN3_SERMA|nr:lipopolysaccharide biosynthesis protein [Serratia marcescens]MBN5205765.1 lipopolysaccharide biosynthesis protein [Serratia marcescens]PNO71534.1 flippase [Serratia marcescens]QHC48079.1 lipopolysaccharide biosynthesis protein [Serratia marcescens]BEM22571.1 lipopolysaccharide biosynthesis protein [Serratia marcescens]
MSSDSLKKKAILGIIWNVAEKFLVQGAKFVIGIILARIISPEDFGLIGMILIFIVLSDIITDGGFSQALIQKKDRKNIDFSTVFYFNILISLLLYALLYVCSPSIAHFFNNDKLIDVVRILSLNIIIKSFYLIHLTKLSIELNFKLRTKINIISVIISGALSLYLAYNGYGVMALVYQTLSNSLITLLLMYFAVKWYPTLQFSMDSLRKLFGFGSKLLLASSIVTIVDNSYSILIGRYFNSRDVGYYTQGRTVPDLLSSNLYSVLQAVMFPVMTSTQDDRERLVRIYKKSLNMTAFIIIPTMVGFSFIAEPFVRVFLTEKWLPAVVVIQWLCLARMVTPISALNCSILNATGRSDIYLKVDLMKLPLTFGVLFMTAPYGLRAVVIGYFAVAVISFFIHAYYPGKLFGYGAWKQLKDMTPIFIATAAMSAVLYFIHIDGGIYELMVKIVVGIVVYVLASLITKSDSCLEIIRILRSKLLKS